MTTGAIVGHGNGSLGNTTSNVSHTRENGEIGNSDDAGKAARSMRWKRQEMARDLLPKERVNKCIWVRVGTYAEIWKLKEKALEYARAHYRGLMMCGSVWMCPICAAKITERRRLELQETIDAAHDQGLIVFLVTLTLQHGKHEKYKIVVAALRDAWRKVRGGRGWIEIKQNYQIVGIVTALEFTVSIDNGGHPHLHVLMFSKLGPGAIDADQLRDDVSSRYEAILKHHARYASNEHGVKVQLGDSHVGDYVAKFGREKENESTWGLAAEMTKGMMKRGRLEAGEHYTPFQLLDMASDGDKQAAAMFQQFALAFKGKHQIGGLSAVRKMLGLSKSLSDEEIAEAGEEKTFRFVQLLDKQWAIIRNKGLRGTALEVASQVGYEGFKVWARSHEIFLE